MEILADFSQCGLDLDTNTYLTKNHFKVFRPLLSLFVWQLMDSGVSGSSGVPAVDRVDLGPSTDSGHVTIPCQVMAGRVALGMMYNHSPAMCIPALVGVVFRIMNG